MMDARMPRIRGITKNSTITKIRTPPASSMASRTVWRALVVVPRCNEGFGGPLLNAASGWALAGMLNTVWRYRGGTGWDEWPMGTTFAAANWLLRN